MDREAIRDALTGPVVSVRTPFSRDGSIDFQGLRSSIDFYISAGSKTMLLTYGDSLFSLLTDQEVAEVTRVTAQHTAGRAMVVAADRIWATPKTVEFAQYAREVGADLLMVLPPDWAGSCTPHTLADHYAAVAQHAPVMIVTNVFSARGATFGLETLKVLLGRVEGIVAVKDDVCGEFARRMALMVRDHWAVLSGGQKQNHLDIHPYGCDGYLSTFISFMPEVAHAYWQTIESGNLAAAVEIIRKIDMPFFDYLMRLAGGFDAGIHGALEIFGIAQRWRRPPYYNLDDEEMAGLSDFLRRLPPVRR